MKKNIFFLGMAALALAACSGNPYDEWSDAQHSDPEDAKTVTLAVAPAAAIDFATLTADSVQLFVPTVTVADQAENTYTVVLNNEDKTATQTVTATENGMVATSDLQTAYYTLVGRKPVSRTIDIDVTSYTKINGESVKEQGTTTATLKADAPEIESVYYVTGYNGDWDNTHTTYRVVNGGGDPYDDPIFTVTLPDFGKDIEFKLTPASGVGGDWSKCITAAVDGTEGKLADSNAGGNLTIKHDATAAAYRVTFDLLNQTWSYEVIPSVQVWYIVGNNNKWDNNGVQNVGSSLLPLAYSGNGTVTYSGYLYTSGFKLIKDPGSWDNQWGESNGRYVKNDGNSGNISISKAGYYTVTLDFINDKLTVTPMSSNPTNYAAIGIAGAFTGSSWPYVAMESCGAGTHLWKYELNTSVDTEGKFLVDGWTPNWGASDFPSGIGVNNGANIPIKAGNYTVIFNDITGGYNFVSK